jgi:transcriptional regulator
MLENDYGDHGRLQFQVAKKNPIWNLFDGTRQALTIFSGPHACISPDWYETEGFVPTWDYVAFADLVVGGQ